MSENEDIIENVFMINPILKDYLYERIDFAEQEGFKVRLSPRKFEILPGGFPCGGYADEDDREVFVAMGNPYWDYVFIHEFCHVDQFLCKPQVLKNLIEGKKDLYLLYDQYISGKKMSAELLEKCIRVSREFELDCEKRATAQIIKYDLPIAVDDYVKRANAYIYLYNAMAHYRKHIKPGKNPSNIEKIYCKMPNHFTCDYEQTPDWYLKLVKKHCL